MNMDNKTSHLYFMKQFFISVWSVGIKSPRTPEGRLGFEKRRKCFIFMRAEINSALMTLRRKVEIFTVFQNIELKTMEVCFQQVEMEANPEPQTPFSKFVSSRNILKSIYGWKQMKFSLLVPELEKLGNEGFHEDSTSWAQYFINAVSSAGLVQQVHHVKVQSSRMNRFGRSALSW